MQSIDEAGNRSATKTINVYKDSKKPEVGNLEITEEKPDGFTMHLGATDELSGIGKVECTVNGSKIPDEQVKIDQITEAGVTFTVTGLNELSSYTIFVKVYDNAGNPSTATKEITGETTAAIGAPVITILNNDTWCNTTKTVEIPEVEGYKIIYTENGTEPTPTNGTVIIGTGTGKITFTVGTENATVKAIYSSTTKNITSNVGQAMETAKIDKTPPTVTVEKIERGKTWISVKVMGYDTLSRNTR